MGPEWNDPLLVGQNPYSSKNPAAFGRPETKPAGPEWDAALLATPDADLDPVQLKEKQRQKGVKGAAEAREKGRQKREQIRLEQVGSRVASI